MNTVFLKDEAATLAFGATLAQQCPSTCIIFLTGHLGAGKTTLVRGFLQALGYTGTIKSPTYTLVEPYHIGDRTVFHFDLYRLQCPEELDNIGLQDYLAQPSILLIEWPEHGGAVLPKPDMHISLEIEGTGRRLKIQNSR